MIRALFTLAFIPLMAACNARDAPNDQAQISSEVLPCRQLTVAQLYNDENLQSQERICTNGRVEFVNDELIDNRQIALLPLNPNERRSNRRELILSYSSDLIRFAELRSGDVAMIEATLAFDEECFDLAQRAEEREELTYFGCPPPQAIYLTPTSLSINGQRVEATTGCNRVAIDDLYRNALSYKDQIVCTEGVVNTFDDGSSFIALSPAALGRQWRDEVVLELMLLPEDAANLNVQNGQHISVRGRFGVSEGCYRQVVDGPSNDEEYICLPIAAPIWIIAPEIVRIGDPAD